MIDVERTIISQYGNSPTILQLVRNMNEHIDPRANIDAFYDFVWNVDTARGFGLDIWGRIVNVGRELRIPEEPLYFGFISDTYPFNEQPFYDRDSTSTQTYRLADDAYRKLILAKALANITAVDAAAINQLLQNLFEGRGRCYVSDMGNMRIRYTFEFLLTPYEFAIMTQSGVTPRPAGMYAYLINFEPPVFGFAPDSAPFNQAPFISVGATHAVI